MKCKSITVQNFRNLESQTVNFSDGVTVLWGRNAQGKTNLLEAVYIFARGRSFRTQHDRELIRFGEKFCTVSIDCENDDFSPISRNLPVYKKISVGKTLKAEIPSTGGKQFYRNGIKLDSVSEVIGSFRAVLFAPEHLSLVTDGPGFRRNFLDIAVSQLKPVYIGYLSRHNAIVNQRNALLKDAQQKGKMISKADKIQFAELLEPWSEQLAAVDSEITVRRRDYISRLSGHVKTFFSDMTGNSEFPELKYTSSCGSDSDSLDTDQLYQRYMKLFCDNVDRETRYGSTQYGIHKDDIGITLNSREARLFGSQGQQRSIALMMKLAEGELSNEETGEYPVFLLDDVMGELDDKRRSFVLSELKNRQVIVTSCEPSLFEANRDTKVSFIEVKDGTATEKT